MKAKLTKFGGMLLESESVALQGGNAVCATSGKSVSFAEMSAAAYHAKKLPQGTQPGLIATHFWEPPNFTFPFGAHIVVSEVDRETGEIEIKRYVCVDDCGRIINPLIVDGQVHGGVAQGLGQALWEQAIYDDTGQLVSGELTDYALPKASGMPWIESSHTETPSPVNPLGVKGVGEAGTIGCSPAVVNSVVDALSPLGVKHVDMPNAQRRERIHHRIHHRRRTADGTGFAHAFHAQRIHRRRRLGVAALDPRHQMCARNRIVGEFARD